MKLGDVLVDKIRRQLLVEDRNFIAVTVGDTGVGKSRFNIQLAKRIDPTFTVDNVVFSFEELLKLLNSGKLQRVS